MFELGCLMAVGFHCFLRTGELLALRPCDFLLREGRGRVNLRASKGGTRHNVKESVTILDPLVTVLLQDLIQSRRQAQQIKIPVWLKSGIKFRDEFAKVLAFFKVDHF